MNPDPASQAITLPMSVLTPSNANVSLLPDTVLADSASPRPSIPVLNPGFVDTGGATSFTQRHPRKDIQAPRSRLHGSKSDAVKLSQAEMRAQKADKAGHLQEGVEAIIELRDHAIKDLADKLSVHEKVIQNLVNGGTHYVKHRHPGAFNALVHKATGEMNNGMSSFFCLSMLAELDLGPPDLETGERHKLKEIQATVLLGMENDAFSQAYIDEAIEELERTRKVKTMGSRSSNTAAYADARATTGSMTNEVSFFTTLTLLFCRNFCANSCSSLSV